MIESERVPAREAVTGGRGDGVSTTGRSGRPPPEPDRDQRTGAGHQKNTVSRYRADEQQHGAIATSQMSTDSCRAG